MSEQTGFKTLFEQELSIDQEAVRRDQAIIGDEIISLLDRANRIALAQGESTLIQPPEGTDPGRVYLDVSLICVVYPHPECRFRWARLTVDLTPTPGARIRDMAPREVRGKKPIKLKTTLGVAFKFTSVSVNREHTESRTHYFPEIMSSGVGFTKGYWDFQAQDDEYLHANRELRLLISAPAGVPVRAGFNLRARVSFSGAAGIIPLLGRSGAIAETHRLD